MAQIEVLLQVLKVSDLENHITISSFHDSARLRFLKCAILIFEHQVEARSKI